MYLLQWDLYIATAKFHGLSSQVVFHDRENKHDSVKFLPVKWQICMCFIKIPRSHHKGRHGCLWFTNISHRLHQWHRYTLAGPGWWVLSNHSQTSQCLMKPGVFGHLWKKSVHSQYIAVIFDKTKLSAITHQKGHDEVIKWKHFSHYWPFVRGIHRFPVNSPHKG